MSFAVIKQGRVCASGGMPRPKSHCQLDQRLQSRPVNNCSQGRLSEHPHCFTLPYVPVALYTAALRLHDSSHPHDFLSALAHVSLGQLAWLS